MCELAYCLAGDIDLSPSKLVVIFLSTLSLAAGVTVACVNVEYADRAFRCDPAGKVPRCPDGYFCCSDDPTALSISKGKPTANALSSLPALEAQELGSGDWAEPLFAGNANARSRSGVCVKRGSEALSIKAGIAQGCPIPCNPKWSRGDVEKVCGVSGAACCQTVEVTPEDCVLDPDSGCYRPARGSDVYKKGSAGQLSTWSGNAHRTHQDPNGVGCKTRYPGSGGKDSPEFALCVKRLTTADQRGLCVPPVMGNRVACPLAADAYQSACDRKNSEMGKSDC